MAETYKQLGQMILTTGDDTVYTVPASTSAIIKNIKVVNYSGAAATVALWQGSGDAIDVDADIILPPVSIDAGGWAEFDGSICMEAAAELHADGETATSLTITVYGLEIS